MNEAIMNALDAVSGSLASAYITVNGNRYHFIQFINFESSAEAQIAEVPILGKLGKGSKPAGWKGTWKGTAHYNQSIFRQLLLDYKKTGILPAFDIQVTNLLASTQIPVTRKRLTAP